MSVKYKILHILPAILWMGVIFCFSAEDAAASSRSSSGVLDFLLDLFGKNSLDDTMMETQAYGTLTWLIRKSAHLLLYTVLGGLLYFALRCFPQYSGRQKFTLSLTIGIVYAALDELHQYFVPGRACQWQDVFIDSVGILLGIGAVYLLYRLTDRNSISQ